MKTSGANAYLQSPGDCFSLLSSAVGIKEHTGIKSSKSGRAPLGYDGAKNKIVNTAYRGQKTVKNHLNEENDQTPLLRPIFSTLYLGGTPQGEEQEYFENMQE